MPSLCQNFVVIRSDHVHPNCDIPLLSIQKAQLGNFGVSGQFCRIRAILCLTNKIISYKYYKIETFYGLQQVFCSKYKTPPEVNETKISVYISTYQLYQTYVIVYFSRYFFALLLEFKKTIKVFFDEQAICNKNLYVFN